MKYRDVMRGADPELFLIDSNGKYISSIGKIGGSKKEPKPIDDRGSAIQEDNVAVEFNIIPAKSREEFQEHIKKVLHHLFTLANAMGLRMDGRASAFFPEDQLQDPKAKEFGCEPDFNAWELDYNSPPECPMGMENLRTAGGHLHLSWVDPTDVGRLEIVHAHDIFVVAPSIELDEDVLRRKLYGGAGACRMKPYGVEVRGLSNFWILSPENIDWVYSQSEKAIDYLNSGGGIDFTHKPIVQAAINNNDKTALEFLKRNYPID